MKIKKVELTNFRNYDKLTLEFSDSINIIYGDNAQGKTNILESIYILGITKSFRYGNEIDLIKYGKNNSKITGIINNNGVIKELKVFFSKDEKKVYVNDNPYKISDYISNMYVILFHPNYLEVISGAPSIRRNLLNIQISQLYKNSIKDINEYNKILKIRNEYLKQLFINNLSDYKYLEVINDKLIEKAVKIYKSRYNYLKEINNYIGKIYKNITSKDGFKIVYQNNIDVINYEEDEIREKFRKKLNDNLKREMAQGVTLYGPHRDDFLFLLDNKDLKIYGSQGQQRVAVIAYKLAEISLFKKVTNTYPILLLDDIFSEIDNRSKNKMLKYIKNTVQTIITTTDINEISVVILNDAKLFKVKNGKVVEKVAKNERK